MYILCYCDPWVKENIGEVFLCEADILNLYKYK